MLIQVEQVDETHFRIVDQWEGFRFMDVFFETKDWIIRSSGIPEVDQSSGKTSFYVQGSNMSYDNNPFYVPKDIQASFLAVVKDLNNHKLIETPIYSYFRSSTYFLIRVTTELHSYLCRRNLIPRQDGITHWEFGEWVNYSFLNSGFFKIYNILQELDLSQFPIHSEITVSKHFFKSGNLEYSI